MLAIEIQVIQTATRQKNGRWAFEGKDTHSWLGEAERFRALADRGTPGDYRAYADEAYLISGRLQAMDNYEEVATS